MIITRGHKVHWSKNTESHHEIISELGLRETDARGDVCLVPVEIYPDNGKLDTPLGKKWKFYVDVDDIGREIPDWFDAEKAEAACRAALKDWKEQKVITKDTAVLKGGQFYVYGGIIRSVYGGTIESVRGGIIEYVYGGIIMHVSGGIIRSVHGGIIQHVRGGMIQHVYGGIIKYVYGGIIKYVSGGIIKSVSGGTIKSVRGGIIESVRGGTIQSVRGGTIIVYTRTDPSILKTSKAVMIDRSGDAVKCIVGKD